MRKVTSDVARETADDLGRCREKIEEKSAATTEGPRSGHSNLNTPVLISRLQNATPSFLPQRLISKLTWETRLTRYRHMRRYLGSFCPLKTTFKFRGIQLFTINLSVPPSPPPSEAQSSVSIWRLNPTIFNMTFNRMFRVISFLFYFFIALSRRQFFVT